MTTGQQQPPHWTHPKRSPTSDGPRIEQRLFDVVARLRSGESTSSRDLDEACHEARVLVDQLRALESREAAMLGRLRERDVAAELRASAEATRAETASLTLGGKGTAGTVRPRRRWLRTSERAARRPRVGEDRDCCTGRGGSREGTDARALARDVFEQERRLVESMVSARTGGSGGEVAVRGPLEVRGGASPSSIIEITYQHWSRRVQLRCFNTIERGTLQIYIK